jgi:hypothetical protein
VAAGGCGRSAGRGQHRPGQAGEGGRDRLHRLSPLLALVPVELGGERGEQHVGQGVEPPLVPAGAGLGEQGLDMGRQKP